MTYRWSENPAKFHHPFWCPVLLQYVYKWLITQAIANWVTSNKVQNDRLFVERIRGFVSVVKQSIVARVNSILGTYRKGALGKMGNKILAGTNKLAG